MQIYEYLLSKSKPKTESQIDVVYKLFETIFKTPIDKVPEARDCIEKAFGKYKFDNIRVSWTTNAVSKSDRPIFKEYAFNSIIDNDGFVTQVCGNFIDNAEEHKEFYDDDISDFSIAYDSTAIEIENYDYGFIVENIEADEETDPKLKTYWGQHEEWIELSDRRIVNEIDGFDTSSDADWGILDDIVKSYIDAFEDEYDVELKIYGNNGRHVCCAINFYNTHNYEKLVDAVNKYQNAIIDEAIDTIEANK